MANAEKWDGTSWTEVSDLNTAREYGGNSGTTSTSALGVGGSPQLTVVEAYDGTSWTEVAEINTGRSWPVGGGGSSTSALNSGGYTTTTVANTESWNGSSWTELGDLSNAVYVQGSGSNASTSAQISFYGARPGYVAASEEWTASLVNKTITVS